MSPVKLTTAALLAIAPVSATAAALAEPAAETAAPGDAKDRVVCKMQSITGSRVGREKVCMTQRNWDLQAANAKERTRRAQKVQGATNGG